MLHLKRMWKHIFLLRKKLSLRRSKCSGSTTRSNKTGSANTGQLFSQLPPWLRSVTNHVLRIHDSPVLQSPEWPLLQEQWQISFRGHKRTIRIRGWDYVVKPATIPWSQQLKGTMQPGSDLVRNLVVWSGKRAPFLSCFLATSHQSLSF